MSGTVCAFSRRVEWRSFGSLSARRGRNDGHNKPCYHEPSLELGIQPSVIRNWMRHYEAGAKTAEAPNEDAVPASQLREE